MSNISIDDFTGMLNACGLNVVPVETPYLKLKLPKYMILYGTGVFLLNVFCHEHNKLEIRGAIDYIVSIKLELTKKMGAQNPSVEKIHNYLDALCYKLGKMK